MPKSAAPAKRRSEERKGKSAAKVAKPGGKPALKPSSKAPAKVVSKPVAKAKVDSKAVVKTTKQAATKPAATTKPAAASLKPVAATKPVSAKVAPATGKPKGTAAKVEPPADAKTARKGITIVNSKPQRRPSEKPKGIVMPTLGQPLIRPGGRPPKPLIDSGPNAKSKTLDMSSQNKPKKSPFDKRELGKFRAILLRKRAELVGDVSTMESEALMGQSGSLSHLPQHMAEQGSDVAGQSLSLDLAAADRRLIKEIDDALRRIEDGTYGVCELTGKPIRAERLEELPWARYSIEAARALERRSNAP
ncbi:MAG: TraR/DksA C4-type zinc finger protein [Phycisphaerales bacterium]